MKEMPAPWFGIDHGKQWPWWLGTVALGVALILVGFNGGAGPVAAFGVVLGVALLLGTNLAGVFVMARRLARRKGRGVGLATVMAFLFGWIAVLVYACMTTPGPVSFSERERMETEIAYELQRQRERLRG
jgi:ABC-type transport system involved in multi-copper enzyme maturation permease subunit